MRQRPRFATLGLVLALATFGPQSQLQAGPGGTSRPFKGRGEGVVTGVTPSGALIAVTTGTATHLGEFTRTEFVFVNGFAISGNLIFTAANGDQLWADFTGQFTSPTTAGGIYTFTGGTGRFAGATGTASFAATTATTPDGVTHLAITFDGTVSP